jgi:radical SAM-linked protein
VERYRLTYAKLGNGRFVGHLDLCGAIGRATRRAGLPVAYTEGFTPRPRLSFGPPLPLFIEGEEELFDLDLTERIDPDRLIERLNETLPVTIRMRGARPISSQSPSIMARSRLAHYRAVRLDGPGPDLASIDELLAQGTVTIEKNSKGAKKTVDIRPAIRSLALVDGAIEASVEASPSRTLNLFDLLAALVPGFGPARCSTWRLVRIGLVLEE